MADVLTCDACGERYDPLQLVAGEPCPKLSCGGEVVEEADHA